MPRVARNEDVDAIIAERESAREARWASRAAMAAEKAQGTSLERAKLAALEEIARKNPGGSLPSFLSQVGKKMGAKFARPADEPEREPAPVATEITIAMPLSLYRPPFRSSAVDGPPLHQALHAADTLGRIAAFAGLRAFASMALTCRAWRDAIDAKAAEWGVLAYVKNIGGGYGKRKGQLDTPTWLCVLPSRDNLLNTTALALAVIDSCNARVSLTRFDGTVSRVHARCGLEAADEFADLLSQPASVCYDEASGSAYVVATIGVSDRRLLRYALPEFTLIRASAEGVGATLLDAPEGMTCWAGVVFVVDTARHRLAAFDAVTLAFLGTSGGYSDRRHRWHHRSGEPIFASPYDVVAHDGELYVSDTHNDRVQVLSAQHPARWIGVIGQSGHGPGQFTYPRGLAIARRLLYVCEERQVLPPRRAAPRRAAPRSPS